MAVKYKGSALSSVGKFISGSTDMSDVSISEPKRPRVKPEPFSWGEGSRTFAGRKAHVFDTSTGKEIPERQGAAVGAVGTGSPFTTRDHSR